MLDNVIKVFVENSLRFILSLSFPFDEPYPDCVCYFRECTMNLINPATTDPIIATYSNQLVGLSLSVINNQILIPNMMAYIAA